MVSVGEDYQLPLDRVATASPEDRIRSVWPFVMTCVAEFYGTLTPREKTGFSQQDLQQEVWIELRQKDEKFDPTIGKYITFAKRIVQNCLATLRDRNGVVAGPKDARRTMRIYREKIEAGTLSDKKRQTYEAISRVASTTSIDATTEDHSALDWDSPVVPVQEKEEAQRRRRAVARLVASLPPVEARVLGALYGLWGRDPMTSVELAGKLGATVDDVANIRRRAFRRIARRLAESGVSSPFSEN